MLHNSRKIALQTDINEEFFSGEQHFHLNYEVIFEKMYKINIIRNAFPEEDCRIHPLGPQKK
jgi:hypothetical protein